MEKIKTNKAPNAVGPYSQGILVGNVLYTSGQIAIDPSTNKLVENNIESQANQAFKNIKAILEEANMDFNNVVKTTVFLKNINDFSVMNEIYEKYFISNPARSCVEVANLPKNALIEIEVIAVK